MSNVLINGQHLTDIADAIRAKSGTEETFLPSQLAGAINNLTTEEKWKRPAEWPNLDLLSHDDYAIYFTIDNRAAPTKFSVNCADYPILERVSIGADGTVTILETVYTATASDPDITISIPAEAGDYPVYRLSAAEGKNITYFGFASDYDWIKVLEMWFNAPKCGNFSIGYSYRDTLNYNIVAMTFINFAQNHRSLNCGNKMRSLRCIRNYCQYPLYISSFIYNYSLEFLEGDIRLNTGDLDNRFRGCRVIKEIDLSNMVLSKQPTSLSGTFRDCFHLRKVTLPTIDMSKVVRLNELFYTDSCLEEFTMPEGDYSAVTNVSSMFYECHNLRTPIIFPKTLTCSLGQSVFASCTQLPCVVFLAETILPLSHVNAFNNLYNHGRNFHLFVRQSLIEEYQTATNWSTIYAANPNFFQPIEGSKWEYLLEE